MQRKPDNVEWILGGIIVAAVLFVWFSSKSNDKTVAIIRMDDIVKEVGWDVQARNNIQRERGAVEADIARRQQLLQADLDAKREEYGESATPEQLENLQMMEQQMQAETQQLMRRSQEGLQKIRMQQMQDFIGEVEPIILKLSTERNFTVVFDRMRSGIFYFDQTVDITDAVVEELRRQALDFPTGVDSIPANSNTP